MIFHLGTVKQIKKKKKTKKNQKTFHKCSGSQVSPLINK